jgi:AcrR family transcriptional regulator
MSTVKKREPSPVTTPPQRGRPPLAVVERERILSATTSVFLENGFERASTNEIARRAHTSKQTLYALFPTKADLFVGVMSAHTEELFSRHGHYIESGKAPGPALTEMGERILTMFSAPTFLALYRILVAEAHHFPDLARQLWSVCMERGYGLLAEYLKSRGIGGPAYRQSAAQFVSFVLGDFVVSAMLNPDVELSGGALKARVRDAVRDFLRLHPVAPPRKKG